MRDWTHDLQGSFQQGQGCANRCIGGHVGDVHVARRGERAAFLDDVLEQSKENLAWFFVRQGEDVVADGAGRDIYISKLSRLDGCVITLDT